MKLLELYREDNGQYSTSEARQDDVSGTYVKKTHYDELQIKLDEQAKEIEALKVEINLIKKGWINVNDKMPQRGEYLLTLDDIGRQFESQLFFYGDEDRPEFKVISTVWEHSNVTHWKLLPPKVDK